ncbi:ABC transporter permease subunit [Lederbergia galactosidilytica]|uniref:Membrane protein n=1 Tax=Lederbergia galactosidilytica TaxID=217031 RepID=A0A177ZHH1_9BACI|nr:ABC transporter permease subunit [Lederbergia galactosidilytica]OAK67396.1 membrane protein [Lederbergia galactosidilytica]
MNVFLTLVQKDWIEAWRDKKWIWLPVVISLLAISQPISQYYMPQILDMAGNLPEGTVIEIPVPTGGEVLAGTLGQLGIIGTAIFVLSVMGSIAHERNSGALSLVMVRPVQAFQYIISKWVSNAIILLFSFVVGYSLSYYYTNLLFERVEIKAFLGSLFIYSLWILFVLTITLLTGTLLKNVGGIAGVSVVVLAVLSLGSSLFPKYMEWSPANAQSQASEYLLTGGIWGDSLTLMIIASLLLLIGLFLFTVYSFKRYERY